METLLQHDKSYTVSPAPGPIFIGKELAGTNVKGAEGALPSLCKWLALPVHH